MGDRATRSSSRVAARHALASADVVVADRLAPRELLDELGPHVELVDVAKLPRGRARRAQEDINELIVDRALAGKRVVRFKGGDSFVFGRGFEEVEACAAAGVPVTVVPGLTSALAVPARAGIPVTHRGVAHEFTVVSGPPAAGPPRLPRRLGRAGPPPRHARAADGRRERARDRRRPRRGRPGGGHAGRGAGRGHPAGRAGDVLHPRHGSRDDLARDGVRPPAIIVIGDVVRRGQAASTSVAELVAVTRADDPRLADYRDLRDVELRKHVEAEHGLFLAEGEKVVRRAVEAGYAPRSFLMAERWLRRARRRARRHRRAVLRDVGGAGRGGHRLPRAPRRAGLPGPHRRCPASTRCSVDARSVLVLEDLVDHTNVGAVFRSGAAMGFDAVLLAPRCADPLYRRSVKVAMGAVFSLPWTRLDDWYAALPSLSARGFTTVALTLGDDSVPIEDAVRGVDRLALVLGSEGHGLSGGGSAAPTCGRPSRWRRGSTRSTWPAASAVACYVAARR